MAFFTIWSRAFSGVGPVKSGSVPGTSHVVLPEVITPPSARHGWASAARRNAVVSRPKNTSVPVIPSREECATGDRGLEQGTRAAPGGLVLSRWGAFPGDSPFPGGAGPLPGGRWRLMAVPVRARHRDGGGLVIEKSPPLR
jgi:hypothetical protein